MFGKFIFLLAQSNNHIVFKIEDAKQKIHHNISKTEKKMQRHPERFFVPIFIYIYEKYLTIQPRSDTYV